MSRVWSADCLIVFTNFCTMQTIFPSNACGPTHLQMDGDFPAAPCWKHFCAPPVLACWICIGICFALNAAVWQKTIKHLGDVSATAHCNTCRIDFNANFDHNVEVIFRPNPSVRAVDASVEFCVGSPQRQPHIVFSLIVPPREELPLSTMLNEGRYTSAYFRIARFTDLAGNTKAERKKSIFGRDSHGWDPNRDSN